MSNRVEIIRLLLEDIEDFHEKLCKEYGTRPGLHDRGLLESAVNNVYQTAFREDVYPTLCSKAARLCFGLIKNHPFVDGNKRTGIHSMLVFLYVNDIDVDYEQEEIENIAVMVAEGKMNDDELKDWLERRAKKEKISLSKKL